MKNYQKIQMKKQVTKDLCDYQIRLIREGYNLEQMKDWIKVKEIGLRLKYRIKFLRTRINEIKYEIAYFTAICMPYLFKTRYYEFWSRDCDMCERTERLKLPSKYHAAKFLEEQSGWAEGPQLLTEISKKEYDEFTSWSRDRAFEACENGRGNSIYV